MRRLLDVLFQHLRWLGAILLVLPLVVGVAVLSLDDSRTISARIHIDPANFVATAIADVLPASQAPADAAAALIPQLVATDWFTEGLLSRPQARPAGRSPAERRAEIEELREHLVVTAEGSTGVVLRYRTHRPERGVALVGALIDALGTAVQSIEGQRASVALRVAAGELDRARDEEQRAIDEASRYAYTSDQHGEALQQDPTYLRLVGAARAATQHVEDLAGLTEQARAVTAAIPQVLSRAAIVVDRPRIEAGTHVAVATRAWALALTVAAAGGALVIYVIALHDPRLRALDDVRAALGDAHLLSVPAAPPPSAGPTAPSPLRLGRYRGLVDTLTNGRPGGILSVVSPHRGDGRSTVAAELAAALASQPGIRVHVLDLHAERLDPTAALRALVDAVESGALDQCRGRYTWTVVDTPPLLDSPGVADVVDRSDAWVLVGRYRSTRVDALIRSVAQLTPPCVAGVMTAHASPVPAWVSRPRRDG